MLDSIKDMSKNDKIAVIGGGSWGTAIAKVLAENVARRFGAKAIIKLWVYEEEYKGRSLINWINTDHENAKYLPGIKLPSNIVASPNLLECVSMNNITVLVVPHEFVHNIFDQVGQCLRHDREPRKIVSLTKGFLGHDKHGGELITRYIEKLTSIPVCVLMGANIARNVAAGHLAEATVAGRNPEHVEYFRKLFHNDYFSVSISQSPVMVELCGALKNIVSLAYGISHGLGHPSNTSAAIIREGVLETIAFCSYFAKEDPMAFFESCGIADLFASCLDGRNYQCGVCVAQNDSSTLLDRKKSGQSLQGIETAKAVFNYLKENDLIDHFPLFSTVHYVVEGRAPCESIIYTIGKCSVSKITKKMSFNWIN